MNFSQVSFARRHAIGLFLIVIAAAAMLTQIAWVQSAAPQNTKRTFENKIPEHVPLKVKIKKEKEEKSLTHVFTFEENWMTGYEA